MDKYVTELERRYISAKDNVINSFLLYPFPTLFSFAALIVTYGDGRGTVAATPSE